MARPECNATLLPPISNSMDLMAAHSTTRLHTVGITPASHLHTYNSLFTPYFQYKFYTGKQH